MTTDGPINQDNQMSGQVHPLDYFIVLAKHSRLIIFTSLIVTVLVYLILFVLPNTYTATARLLPPQQNMTLSGQILDSLGGASISSAAGGTSGFGGMAMSLLGLKTASDLYVGMLSGDTVFDRIIARFKLKEVYDKEYIEDARKALRKNTDISAGKKDNLISIEVTGYTPEQAVQMANAFVEELERLLQDLAAKEAKGRLTFLEKERLQASNNLTKAEEALRLFSEKNSVLQIDTQTRGVLEYIARLRAEIDSKEVGIQVLRQQATPYNFDVVRMETEIKGLREKLRTAETQYDNCITDVCVPTSKAPRLALEYVRLYREAKFQEALFQLYLKLMEIARLDMVRDYAQVQVVDPAVLPEKRSNKRVLPAVLVGALTFFFMIFGVLGWEHIKSSEDNLQRLQIVRESLRPWRDMWKKIKNKLLFRKRY